MASPRIGVKAIIVRDGHVLMNRFVPGAGSGEKFELPGGGQEHGEDQVAALIRECREEIGALVEVHSVACLFEVRTDRRFRDGTPIPLFHQVNVCYWTGLAEGEEPSIGAAPDPDQQGTSWLPLERLGDYDIQPPELARWLESDPSGRPLALGVCAP